jgi:hypothetical protein
MLAVTSDINSNFKSFKSLRPEVFTAGDTGEGWFPELFTGAATQTHQKTTTTS